MQSSGPQALQLIVRNCFVQLQLRGAQAENLLAITSDRLISIVPLHEAVRASGAVMKRCKMHRTAAENSSMLQYISVQVSQRARSAGTSALQGRPIYTIENPCEGNHNLEWDSSGSFLATCSTVGRLRCGCLLCYA